MISLWISIGLLTAIVVTVIAYSLLRTHSGSLQQRSEFDLTVYRDQLKELEHEHERGLLSDEQAESAITEIKRRMLAIAEPQETSSGSGVPAKSDSGGVLVAGAIICLMVAGSVALYMHLGAPMMPDAPFAARDLSQQQNTASRDDSVGNASIEKMVEGLARRLMENPDDLKGWSMLGRSYLAMNKVDEALNAMRKAMELSNNGTAYAADYAEALVVTAEAEIPVEALAIFSKVRAQDPMNTKARFYLGANMAQEGDVQGALQEWVDLVAILPTSAPSRAIIQQQIDRAASELGIKVEDVAPRPEALELAKQVVIPPVIPAAPATRGPSSEQVEAVQKMDEADRKALISDMVKGLAARLKENPNDKGGWEMLARSYTVLGEHEKAKLATEKANSLP